MRSTTTLRATAATIMLAGALAGPGAAFADRGDEIVVGDGESIQDAIDAAEPGTTIIVRGDHVENIWIDKDGISLVGRGGATITQPENPTFAPCEFFGPPGTSTTVCVFPQSEEFPVPAAEQLSGFSITGLTVVNPSFDAIGVYATNDVRVSRNTTSDTGCSGIFLLFVNGLTVDRNTVTGAVDCNGIDVTASSNGTVTRNVANGSGLNGIAINDSSDIVVSRNTATGNCQGIGIFDNPDPSALPTIDVTVTRNTANANNTVCFPFDPPGSETVPIGGTGIIVAGAENTVIARNITNDNVVDGFTLTASGIFVTDFPGDDPSAPFSVSTNTTVDRNTAFGNTSDEGPRDLLVLTGGSFSIDRNSCGVSVPDDSWCAD